MSSQWTNCSLGLCFNIYSIWWRNKHQTWIYLESRLWSSSEVYRCSSRNRRKFPRIHNFRFRAWLAYYFHRRFKHGWHLRNSIESISWTRTGSHWKLSGDNCYPRQSRRETIFIYRANRHKVWYRRSIHLELWPDQGTTKWQRIYNCRPRLSIRFHQMG